MSDPRPQAPFSAGGFSIRTDQLVFNTDTILDVERGADLSLLITLEDNGGKVSHHLTGQSAIQAWAQLMELVEWVDDERRIENPKR